MCSEPSLIWFINCWVFIVNFPGPCQTWHDEFLHPPHMSVMHLYLWFSAHLFLWILWCVSHTESSKRMNCNYFSNDHNPDIEPSKKSSVQEGQRPETRDKWVHYTLPNQYYQVIQKLSILPGYSEISAGYCYHTVRTPWLSENNVNW